jgi:hypothetical protein
MGAIQTAHIINIIKRGVFQLKFKHFLVPIVTSLLWNIEEIYGATKGPYQYSSDRAQLI